MINKLTQDQIDRLPEFMDKWKRIGLDTAPADRPRAEAAILHMYQISGKPAPRIVWCGSPLSQGITRSVLLDPKFQAAMKHAVGTSIRESVGTSIRESVWEIVGPSIGASVRANVSDSISDNVWEIVLARVMPSGVSGIGASVRDSVMDNVRAGAWDSVRESVRESVRDSVRESMRDNVRAGVWDSIRDSVVTSAWDNVRDSVGSSIRDSVGSSIRDSVVTSAWESIGAGVWESVSDNVWESVCISIRESIYGQHDSAWLGFYEFFNIVCGLKKQTEKLEGLWELSKSAGWVLPHEKICLVSERPCALNLDDRGLLHCEDGPAMAYPDGLMIFAIHGVHPIPEGVITHPELITIDQINSEGNGEIRRIMIERMGHAKYLDETGAKEIHSDAIPIGGGIDGFILRSLIVDKHGAKFLCGHDGSTERIYFMSVDPESKTCAEAHESISGFKDSLIVANA